MCWHVEKCGRSLLGMTWHDVAWIGMCWECVGMWRSVVGVCLECAWGELDMSCIIVVRDVICVKM